MFSTTVPIALVKELRERTGASLGKCRQAVAEGGGDMEKAVEWLRKRGIRSMEKRTAEAVEALLALKCDSAGGAIVELRAETDFVTRSELFQRLAGKLAEAVATGGKADAAGVCDVATILEAPLPDAAEMSQLSSGAAVATALLELGSVLGEKLVLGKALQLNVAAPAVLAGYVHPKFSDGAAGVGKAAALVAVEAHPPQAAEALAPLALQLAKHCVAIQPRYVSPSDIPEGVLNAERDVAKEAHLSGLDPSKRAKAAENDEILKKVVEGKMKKFYQEHVLLKQEMVLPGDAKPMSVEQWLADQAASIGASSIEVKDFRLACL